jgi:ornithine cyclodeaminase/alanine dehydrogenase-like protein (mu-crystallin family)
MTASSNNSARSALLDGHRNVERRGTGKHRLAAPRLNVRDCRTANSSGIAAQQCVQCGICEKLQGSEQQE